MSRDIAHDSDVSEVSDDAVRQSAYLLYVERDGSDGAADDDWFRAERELRHRGPDDALRPDA